MWLPFRCWKLCVSAALILSLSNPASARGEDTVLMAYGGHNETIGPYWVAIDRGLYQKHGIDARLLQVRNAQISLAALVSGEVPIFLPSIANVLSGVSAGAKIACAAFPIKGVSRELVVRKDIDSLAALRGKTIGVQSIGGGFWLQTMIALDQLGIDPDKYDLKMRILGDTATVTQALGSGGVDATVIPYSYSEAAKRAGANVLADIGKLTFPYQGTTLCYLQESSSSAPDQVSRLLRGLADAVVLIHDPSAKAEIIEILRKAFRFPKPQDAEASYKVLTIMATLDMTPDPNAWKLVQKITARINPKVAQVELSHVLNSAPMRSLEESGFLAEARKKLR